MIKNTTIKKVSIASFIMMVSVLGSRILGLFREMAIAGASGIHASVDAYQIAFVIPEILNHIMASGFLSITFIPIFTHYLVNKQEEEGYRVFSLIWNTFGVILIFLIGIAMIFAPDLVQLLAPGIDDPNTLALAVKMTRIILPAQFFFFSGGLFNAIQFANERFLFPAIAPLIYNLFIIGVGLLAAPKIGMEGFAWGVLLGAFLGNFVLQFIGARRVGAKYYLKFGIFHPDLIQYVKLTLPLILGLTMTFSTEILFKFFGSYLPTGSIAAMNYSLRVMFLLVGLFAQSVGVAIYPYLAKLAKKETLDELNSLLNKTIMFIFLVIPCATYFMATSREMVTVLFQHGSFDARATLITAGILPYFMIGAFAFAARTIVPRGYYAIQNTLFPTVFSTIAVLLSIPVIYLGMHLFGAKGLAFGLSLCVSLQSLGLYECWNKRSANKGKSKVYAFFIKVMLVSTGIFWVLFYSVSGLRHMLDPSSFNGALIILLLSGLEFLGLFIMAGYLFNIREIQILISRITERINPWKKESKK